MHGVRLAGGWVVNVHSHNHPEAAALADTQKAIAAAREWAAGAPLVFGGDMNLKPAPDFPGLVHVAGNHVDHLFTDGRAAAGKAQVIKRGVAVRPSAGGGHAGVIQCRARCAYSSHW